MSKIVNKLAKVLIANNKKIVTAESCTGGLVAKLLTDVAGSSAWFERGFVTYSNLAKHEMLGVAISDIEKYGAVSEEIVRQMALGALKKSHCDFALSISGIAGPGGGSSAKPIGTVWFAFAAKDSKLVTEMKHFSGGRKKVRQESAEFAINSLLLHIEQVF